MNSIHIGTTCGRCCGGATRRRGRRRVIGTNDDRYCPWNAPRQPRVEVTIAAANSP
jgi:hypothetical protein